LAVEELGDELLDVSIYQRVLRQYLYFYASKASKVSAGAPPSEVHDRHVSSTLWNVRSAKSNLPHTSAYVSIRRDCRILQHTSAYVATYRARSGTSGPRDQRYRLVEAQRLQRRLQQGGEDELAEPY
jgi:hypothetical protein